MQGAFLIPLNWSTDPTGMKIEGVKEEFNQNILRQRNPGTFFSNKDGH